ncbi:REP-associated tyrosine transposase [Pseudoduganella aquatica]|uniref:REP-associated tyrosine transposase n=1 Tax=Pseudoduganella aquatica TaxID=2660641 RepID=UPI001E30D76B|nr:transposase [Pseudoduganella aquatica]
MPNYRRLYLPGGSYFFTVVTEQRRPILCELPLRAALKRAIASVRRKHPFHIAGMVLLPDHLHMIWTLPEGDSDFPLRVRLIKSHMSKACSALLPDSAPNPRRQRKQCSALWQHRYWEHALQSEDDFRFHLDYVHWNPVKHGLVQRVRDWPWSSFHRYVAEGVYPQDWCAPADVAGYALAR